MSSKKILFISYTFPPIPYGGTYRALRLCRGFAEHNLTCHVVTLKEYTDIPNDYELLKKIPDSIIVHRVPIIDPWRKYQIIKNKFFGKLWFKFINKFISFALRFITFPDHMLFWVPFAVFKAKKVIKEQGIDTVLVSSPPDSSQIVGWILKKWLKIRWIADFRDPIYGNVAAVSIINPTKVLDKITKQLLKKYDRFISCSADTLIANTETHAEQLRNNYGNTNVHVIRNSYDPVDFDQTEVKKFPLFTIAHVGSIYGKRNPDILFAAVKQLAAEFAPKRIKLQILFLGLGVDSLRDSIERFGLQEYVTIKDQVPHCEAIESMCRSHLLLLIKATGKWSKGQIPGKFFEYVGSRNPILCIGPRNSEVASLLKNHKLGYVVEDELQQLVSIIRTFYNQYLQTGSTPTLTKKQVNRFLQKRW
jgi:glycosyltransferase involved in cell wall biosynthesis